MDFHPLLPKRIEEVWRCSGETQRGHISTEVMSVRSGNCLQNAGVEFVWQLVEKTAPELLKTKNFGRKSLNEVEELLHDESNGDLMLGMHLHNYPPKMRWEEQR